MILLGDVHGQMDFLRKTLKTRYTDDSVIQLGDLGVGFPKSQSVEFPKRFRFIRGNHDNPAICREHPNYIGDFGIENIEGYKVFYLSGAWSIDQWHRKEGVSWWREEELTIAELDKAIELFTNEKPDIMLSHDGPSSATRQLLNRFHNENCNDWEEPKPTRTGQALEAMFRVFQPKQWFFGHWHVSWNMNIRNTKFTCLNEFESFKIEGKKA